ncbi:dolichol kinase isoform X2 [Sitodiplosis mosellana]|nr:dolichol kinase isoform X2 [Sitodiplosis mosellana]
MVLQTYILRHAPKIRLQKFVWILQAIPSVFVSILLISLLYQGILFGVFIGFITLFTYHTLFNFVLREMPNSFTYGEAAIIAQGLVVFLMNFYIKLNQKTNEHTSEMKQLTIILQIGLAGVALLACCCYFVKFLRGLAFYALLTVLTIVIILFPIDDQMAIVILIEFLIKDLQKVAMIALYVGLIGMTITTVAWQMNRHKRSNTRTRKIFHVLIVLVFVPGIVYQCAFIYVSSGIALALLIVLETMRIIQLSPVYNVLDNSVKCFIDEKDAGLVALTPIYLLMGCSLPLWLHPCPCDLTDSAGFELLPLMAGVISVGIGDTAASIVGSKFGTHQLPFLSSHCQKTAEGTISGIVAQSLVLPLLIYYGLVHYSAFAVLKYLIAITTSSLVETYTDQIDNLVLPLITFILLSI